MSLHVANKMDEVEAAVWWDLSRIVRHFEREGMKRNEAKQAVLNAALRLINDESYTIGDPSSMRSIIDGRREVECPVVVLR